MWGPIPYIYMYIYIYIYILYLPCCSSIPNSYNHCHLLSLTTHIVVMTKSEPHKLCHHEFSLEVQPSYHANLLRIVHMKDGLIFSVSSKKSVIIAPTCPFSHQDIWAHKLEPTWLEPKKSREIPDSSKLNSKINTYVIN